MVQHLLQGLVRSFTPRIRDLGRSKLTFDPRTSSMVLTGTPGHLQFYDYIKDKHQFNVSRLLCFLFIKGVADLCGVYLWWKCNKLEIPSIILDWLKTITKCILLIWYVYLSKFKNNKIYLFYRDFVIKSLL